MMKGITTDAGIFGAGEARGCPPSKHGTANGYGNWGCRCEACTNAWAKTMWTMRGVAR